MHGSLDELEVQAKANVDAESSAVNLLVSLAGLLAEAKNDPVRVQALSDELKGSADALGAAIVANTPVTP